MPKRCFSSKTIFNYLILLALVGFSPEAFSQTRVITGRITDSKDQPLKEASVSVKGSNTGTKSDGSGRFELNVLRENETLVISLIGFATREVDWSPDNSALTIVLQDSANYLADVVVVGYGTQKRANLTGAVVQVDGKVLANRAIVNIGQGLQGVVGNLNISTVGDPGGVGQPATYNIRGNTSLNGGDPFFVVDGIPASNINNLNPNDIESITILKDAASSAIYGARAAYGVILITTKKGKKGDKISVNYNGLASFSTPTSLPKMANSLQFAETYNISAANSGLAAPFSPEAINRIKQYMADPNSIPVTIPNPGDPNRWDWNNANANVDWFKEFIKPWSFNQKHDLSLSGGGDVTSYYMSFGYFGQGGQLRYGDDKFERFNLTSNVHSEPLKWLRLDLRVRYARSVSDQPFPYSDLAGNWFHLAGTRQPIWPVKNPDGQYSQISTIPYFTSQGRSIGKSNDLWLTGAVEMEPVKNWKINADYSWNTVSGQGADHDAFVYSYAIDGSKYNIAHAQNAISKSSTGNEYSSFNVYTSFEQSFNKHYFKVLVGQQAEVSRFNSLYGTRLNLITDAIPSMGVATGTQSSSEAISHWATMGTFGRLSYNFNEKYLVEFNARYDGTSKFPEDERYGLFPSVSAGYNIARENFFPFKNIFSEFKLRGSYGSLGNQAVANYMYLASVPIYSNLGYLFSTQRPNYLGAPGLVSSDLTWERSKTLDFGVDASLFKNRLSFSFDWYVRNTMDMLGPAEALPATLGVGVPQMNNADLQTKGFELAIGWKDRIGKDFNYNVSVVLSDYVSRVKKYNNPTNLLSTFYNGFTIGELWGFEASELIQTQKQLDEMPDQSIFYGQWSLGDLLYKDLDGDNKMTVGKNTLDDHGDLTIIGNASPRYSFGITAGFNWKGFDFNMFWQGVGKRDIALNGTLFYGLLGGYGSAVWENTLDYWTPENTGAYWPKPYYTGEINKNRSLSSRYLQSAAYMRLKNLQLGYTIAPEILSKWKMKNIRVFVTGENLITFSSINENFDPEVIGGGWGSGKMYPLMKTLTVGLNLGL
ncbi:SusC/RagA family TonB-linked outer membrane protein [Flavitalea sp.]|nr:TonB-dependent receptor [Flavitalea sp.]